MSGMEQFAAEAEGDVIEDVADVEEAEEVADAPQVDPYEDEAKQYGWKPAEEFGGDGNHMSAEAFMTRGPGTSRKALKDVADLKEQQARAERDYTARLERMERAQKANENARIEARAAVLAKAQREAVENGDLETYDKLDEQRAKINKPASAAPVPEMPEAERVAIESWVKQNQWFNADADATNFATQAYNTLTGGGAAPEDALKQVTQWTGGKFPYLGIVADTPAPKPAAAAVDPGSSRGGAPASKASKGWSSIPAGDRAVAEKQIKNGEWDDLAAKMKVSAKEAFASVYLEQ